MGAVNSLLDKSTNYQETAKKEEEQRKNDSRKKMNSIHDQIDVELEKNKLMA